MSEAYTAVKVEMVDQQQPPTQLREEEIPLLFLQDVERHYRQGDETVNVLSDPAVRDGIKEYSSWPTIPQLYVGGEFLGGSDIMMEMYEAGELQQLLAEKGVAKTA